MVFNLEHDLDFRKRKSISKYNSKITSIQLSPQARNQSIIHVTKCHKMCYSNRVPHFKYHTFSREIYIYTPGVFFPLSISKIAQIRWKYRETTSIEFPLRVSYHLKWTLSVGIVSTIAMGARDVYIYICYMLYMSAISIHKTWRFLRPVEHQFINSLKEYTRSIK